MQCCAGSVPAREEDPACSRSDPALVGLAENPLGPAAVGALETFQPGAHVGLVALAEGCCQRLHVLPANRLLQLLAHNGRAIEDPAVGASGFAMKLSREQLLGRVADGLSPPVLLERSCVRLDALTMVCAERARWSLVR